VALTKTSDLPRAHLLREHAIGAALNLHRGHPRSASSLIDEPIGWPNCRPDNALRHANCARPIAGALIHPDISLQDKGKQANASVHAYEKY